MAAIAGSFVSGAASAAPVCVAKGLCVEIPVDPAIFTVGKTAPFQPNVRWGGRAVAVDVSSTGVMIAAADSGGIFRSETSGASWTHVEGMEAFRMRDVRFAPENAAIVLATASATAHVSSRGGIWRSVDGGRTFSRPSSQDGLCGGARMNGESISWVGANDPHVVVATNCGLATSNDYGATWSMIEFTNNRGGTARLLSVAARLQSDGKLRIDACGPDNPWMWRSFDSGTTWTVDESARTNGLGCGDVHQLAAFPLSGGDDVRIVAWKLVNATIPCGNRGEARLAMSVNGGNWSEVPALPPIGGGACLSRPVWVRASQQPTPGTTPARFSYVFSNGFDAWASYCTNAPGGCTSTVPPRLPLDHADPNDAAFDPRTACLTLLASDAGVQAGSGCGTGAFRVVGAGPGGYNALQLYEVTGSHRIDHTDLYFGTQDNDIWSSRSDGTAWEHSICCEGFHLQTYPTGSKDCTTLLCTAPGESYESVIGTLCGPCREFVSPEHFDYCGYNPACGKDILKRPARGNYFPVRFDGELFLWADSPDGYLEPTALYKTDGGGWRVIAIAPGVETPIQNALPVINRRPGGGYVIYQAMRRGSDRTGLMRVDWTGSGMGATTTVEGGGVNSLNSIGLRCEQFVSCDAAFAVDPANPDHVIAADVGENEIKATMDGGRSWTPDAAATYLATDRGSVLFSYPDPYAQWRSISQVRTIAFSPLDPTIVVIGTEVAGVVASGDNGLHWSKIAGSEKVTGATSFYFLKTPRTALASTWGRGLWQITVPSTLPVGVPITDRPRGPAPGPAPLETPSILKVER